MTKVSGDVVLVRVRGASSTLSRTQVCPIPVPEVCGSRQRLSACPSMTNFEIAGMSTFSPEVIPDSWRVARA